jgi:hypothetical protein
MASRLKPFWRYSGAKWRMARLYSPPTFPTLIEPFAGAAGYSLTYPDRSVVLVEKYPIVASVWRYLIGVGESEFKRIPRVSHVDELPGWLPQEARWLVGLRFCAGDSRPRAKASRWTAPDAWLDSLAWQLGEIRHWKVIEGDYSRAPDLNATWFIDPPYQVAGGADRRPGARGRVRYPFGSDGIDFVALSGWCQSRAGQVIVCENVGASWLPFKELCRAQTANPNALRAEAVWERNGV